MDSEKILHTIHILADTTGPIVNRRLNEKRSIDQNLINIEKEINWKKVFIADRTLRFIQDNKLVMKVYDAYQVINYRSLGFRFDQQGQDIKNIIHSAEICSLANKEQVVVQEGTFYYVHTKHYADSRIIQLVSQRNNSLVSDIHIWGS